MFGIRVLTWATLAVLFIALAEYVSHRYFMHRRLLDRVGRPDIFQEHAIDHHRDGRTDVGFDLPISRHFLWGSPFIAVIALVDWFGALILSAGILCYAILWTKLHRAIHDVENNWAKLLWCYPIIMRHHQEHHRRPGRNFAFVFPFTDYLFGTVSRPRKYRELQMKRL